MKYYQYAIYVKGELKWYFGTSDDIDLKEIQIKKLDGLDMPKQTLLLKSED